MDEATDTEVLARSRTHPELLGLIYERHAPAVFRYLARRAGPAAAEDLLGEVLVAVVEARLHVQPHASGSALPWLYGIAGNVLRTHLRRSRFASPPDPHVIVGLTPTEAAEALGLTPVAARSRLRRARMHAQAALRQVMHDAEAKVGHVHLQVGDIAMAKDFYADALGSATTFEAPGALFVSAGGYHHHLAMNVWNSRGAGPRAATLGLGEVAITVPPLDDLGAAAARLRDRGVDVRGDGRSLTTEDPWRNRVTLALAGPAA